MQQHVFAHEIFSLRADIARKEGFNEDMLVKHTRRGCERETEYLNRVMYGFNKFLTFEFRLPIILDKKIKDRISLDTFKVSGLGKIEILSKCCVYKDYALQQRKQIVLVGGLALPTCSSKTTLVERRPLIANRSIDFLAGVAGLYETLIWYHFASISYRINTSAQSIKEGDIFSYSYALGYRPAPPEVGKVDWVFLLENDGIFQFKDKMNGIANKNSGGNVILCGPAFFCSIGNFMIKGGMQFPLLEHVNGCQNKYDFRAMAAMFIQF